MRTQNAYVRFKWVFINFKKMSIFINIYSCLFTFICLISCIPNKLKISCPSPDSLCPKGARPAAWRPSLRCPCWSPSRRSRGPRGASRRPPALPRPYSPGHRWVNPEDQTIPFFQLLFTFQGLSYVNPFLPCISQLFRCCLWFWSPCWIRGLPTMCRMYYLDMDILTQSATTKPQTSPHHHHNTPLNTQALLVDLSPDDLSRCLACLIGLRVRPSEAWMGALEAGE